MTFSSSIIADFAVIMTVAAAAFFIFHKLRQPTIVGYLVAGILIGPYTPPFAFVTNLDVIGAAADLGVILLLFGIGLQFPLAKLKGVGKISVGVAGIEIAFMLLLSFGIARFLNWSMMDALFLGTALASSSTVIIAKVLGDAGKLRETPALIMLGVLVVEDLVVVGLLTVLTSVLTTGQTDIGSLSWQVFRIPAFVFSVLVLGALVIPLIINRAVKVGNNELLLLVVLGLCFGSARIANSLGFSMALGAFLAGVLVASTKASRDCVALIAPVKDMFAAMFFVSMGALIDVSQFPRFLLPALLVTVLMVGGKMVGCGLGTRLFGYDRTTAIKVGLGMSQIGEFAFIVMKVGQDLNAVSPFLFGIVGVAAGITTFLTPYLIRLSYRLK